MFTQTQAPVPHIWAPAALTVSEGALARVDSLHVTVHVPQLSGMTKTLWDWRAVVSGQSCECI